MTSEPQKAEEGKETGWRLSPLLNPAWLQSDFLWNLQVQKAKMPFLITETTVRAEASWLLCASHPSLLYPASRLHFTQGWSTRQTFRPYSVGNKWYSLLNLFTAFPHIINSLPRWQSLDTVIFSELQSLNCTVSWHLLRLTSLFINVLVIPSQLELFARGCFWDFSFNPSCSVIFTALFRCDL